MKIDRDRDKYVHISSPPFVKFMFFLISLMFCPLDLSSAEKIKL